MKAIKEKITQGTKTYIIRKIGKQKNYSFDQAITHLGVRNTNAK